jgi:hypothetical protein
VAQLSKQELVSVVQKLLDAAGTEEELDALLRLLERNVPHPEVSDLIYFPKVAMTADEIIEVALSYRPIQLTGGKPRD